MFYWRSVVFRGFPSRSIDLKYLVSSVPFFFWEFVDSWRYNGGSLTLMWPLDRLAMFDTDVEVRRWSVHFSTDWSTCVFIAQPLK